MNSATFDKDAFDFLADGSGASLEPPKERVGDVRPVSTVSADADGFDAVADIQQRVDEVLASANPLLEAARPLLRMLADMPATLDTSDAVAGLRTLLVREIGLFQKVCDKADLRWKHMAVARYCLCTALDEAANRTTWGGAGVWAAQSLLITFEGEVDGGEKFFLLIGRMATDPQEYVDVLEILYRVLGLGFEGRYSVMPDGRRHLEQIRQRLWTLITGARDAVQPELSPHWRGAPPGRLPLLRSVPVWVSAACAALAVSGLFVFYQYRLLTERHALEARILEIGRERLASAPQRLRLSQLLRDEIAGGVLTVDEDERRSIVVFKGDSMFASGQSTVLPGIEPILDKVAREVARVGGTVLVTGHTDNQPIRSAAFANNLALSEKRAAYVAQILQRDGTPAERIRAVGKGDTQPVGDNATAAGRALNRRVEIMVTL
ncbi:type VI secretion system protein TssL, long form [Burkholderia dolosa]|uniref:type VI secretion system protein TssL, long form n=1 Tax=Burkholderia dolosa TaxID=152500 RepID=UPI001B9F5349|nr:type VI secretion system protein TssL, long form [Burkholderia dolosa]MBR8300512.1 type VI secretion system protein TssL, long form [Burkholderia dolosa]